MNVPGCNEHYVAHILRKHNDFISELDYVYEMDGLIIGNIMYTKSRLTDEQGNVKEILTFGPISVDPDFQRKGIGKALMEKTFDEAVKMGYQAIVIFGNPDNYVARGFKSCKKYNVCLEGDVFPSAMLVKELEQGLQTGGNIISKNPRLLRSMMIWPRNLTNVLNLWKNPFSRVRKNSIFTVILSLKSESREGLCYFDKERSMVLYAKAIQHNGNMLSRRALYGRDGKTSGRNQGYDWQRRVLCH